MVDRRISRSWPLLSLLILSLSSLSLSLRFISSSPCQSVCSASPPGKTADDLVCSDNEFASTTTGQNFQQCVECELGSTFVDSSNGATDVAWGLYNLRYAFSACVFGNPVRKTSISTPCQVSCDPLKNALGLNLNANATLEDLSYCNIPGFQDTVGINRCAACYGRMDEEAYLANFLQTLHIACVQPPRPSQPFPVPADTIFNSTPIATPTPSSTAVAGPSKPANLALIVALPVVFSVVIIAGIVACCFYSARHRRRIMAERNGMRRIQDKSSPTFSPSHPHYQQYQQNQMQPQSPNGFEFSPVPDPVYYSPMADKKENPYIQTQQPSPPQPAPQPQFPIFRSYTPSDYVQHVSPPPPIDTSKIGPGPNQTQVLNLHDQYFPPPPPPAQLAMPPPSIPQTGVEPLRQHHMKTPSLSMPVPRAKKSLDIQQRQQRMDAANAEAIQLQDYGPGEDRKSYVADDDASIEVESPQVFVYDAVNDRYVKERPTPTS